MLECERQNLIEQFKRQRAQLHVIDANINKLKDDQQQQQHLEKPDQIIGNEKGDQETKCDNYNGDGESPSPAYSSISLVSTSNSIDVSQAAQTLTTTTRFDSVTMPASIVAASAAAAAENQVINNHVPSVGHLQYALGTSALPNSRANLDTISPISSRSPISTAFLNSFGQMPSENFETCDHFHPSFQNSILAELSHKSEHIFLF